MVVLIQVTTATLLRSTTPLSWRFFLTAYLIGATANQNLFLSIHEISHNLAYRSPMANRLLAIFANLPIGVPYSASFRVGLILHLRVVARNLEPCLTLAHTALPSYASQSSRSRGPRYRPPDPLWSCISGFCPRKSILCHISNLLLCPSANDGVSITTHQNSPPKRCCSITVQLPPYAICRGKCAMVPPPQQFPSR